MNLPRDRKLIYFSRYTNTATLLIASVVGLIIGISLSLYQPLFPNFTSSLLDTPKLHFAFLRNLFPACILLSVYYLPGFITHCLIFANYLSYGFSGMMFYRTFGDCSWLIRPLLMFSSYASVVVMWFFLFHNSRSELHQSYNALYMPIICFGAITLLDVFFVSPFLAQLIIYF